MCGRGDKRPGSRSGTFRGKIESRASSLQKYRDALVISANPAISRSVPPCDPETQWRRGPSGRRIPLRVPPPAPAAPQRRDAPRRPAPPPPALRARRMKSPPREPAPAARAPPPPKLRAGMLASACAPRLAVEARTADTARDVAGDVARECGAVAARAVAGSAASHPRLARKRPREEVAEAARGERGGAGDGGRAPEGSQAAQRRRTTQSPVAVPAAAGDGQEMTTSAVLDAAPAPAAQAAGTAATGAPSVAAEAVRSAAAGAAALVSPEVAAPAPAATTTDAAASPSPADAAPQDDAAAATAAAAPAAETARRRPSCGLCGQLGHLAPVCTVHRRIVEILAAPPRSAVQELHLAAGAALGGGHEDRRSRPQVRFTEDAFGPRRESGASASGCSPANRSFAAVGGSVFAHEERAESGGGDGPGGTSLASIRRCSKSEDYPVDAADSSPPSRVRHPRVPFTRLELRRIDAAIVKRTKTKLAAGHIGALTLSQRDFEVISALTGVKVERLRTRVYRRGQAMRRWIARAGTAGVATACQTGPGQRSAAAAIGTQHNLPWHDSELARLDTAVAEFATRANRDPSRPSSLTYERTAALIRDGTLGKVAEFVSSRSVDHVLFQLQRSNGWSKSVGLAPVALETGGAAMDKERGVCEPITEEDAWKESKGGLEMQDIPGFGPCCPCCIILGPNGKVRVQRRRWLPDELERLKRGVALYARGVEGRERSDWPAIAATVRTRTIVQCKRRITYDAIQEARRVARCGKSETMDRIVQQEPDRSRAGGNEEPRSVESPASTVHAFAESPGRFQDSAATPPAFRFESQLDADGAHKAIADEAVPPVQIALGKDCNGQSSDVFISGRSQVVVCLRPTCPLPQVVPMSFFRARREALRHASHEDHLRSGSSLADRFAVRGATRLAVRNASLPLLTET